MLNNNHWHKQNSRQMMNTQMILKDTLHKLFLK